TAVGLVEVSDKFERECRETAGRTGRAAFVRLDVLRVRAAPFGTAAPQKLKSTGEVGATATAVPEFEEWSLDPDLYKVGPKAGDERRRLWLDGDHPRILPGSWIVIESADGRVTPFQATDVRSRGLAHYGITGKVTVLDL